MTDDQPDEAKLSDEFERLANNLVGTLKAAWDHPERKRIQEEIAQGLSELSTTLKNEAESFEESDTAQRLKADVETFGERISSSESYDKIRGELLTVLKTANEGLRNVIKEWSYPDQKEDDPPAEGEG